VRCVVLTERCLSVLAVVRPLWIDAQRRFKNAIGANLEGGTVRVNLLEAGRGNL
jgi:hypothetical protein